MFMRVNDGTTVFATHLIKGDFEAIKDNMRPHQLEKEGIVVYGNLAVVEAWVWKQNIPYTVEVLDYEAHKTKTQGIIYQSRTEAIEHILNDKEPKSQVIPNLYKKMEFEKKRNDDLEARLLKLEKVKI